MNTPIRAERDYMAPSAGVSHTNPSREPILKAPATHGTQGPSPQKLLAETLTTTCTSLITHVSTGLRSNRRDPCSTVSTLSSNRYSGGTCSVYSVDEGNSDGTGQKSYHERRWARGGRGAERGAGCVPRATYSVVSSRGHAGKWPWMQHYHKPKL